MSECPAVGSIGWIDLTVPNAPEVRDFYQKVVGWKAEPVEMGGYSDFAMAPPDGSPCAGVCHAQGTNADLPASWIIYIVVEDIEASVHQCREYGGELVTEIKSMGAARYCVIRDPAGAVSALYQSGPEG